MKPKSHSHWCCMCGQIWIHVASACKFRNVKNEIRFFVVCKTCAPEYKKNHEGDYDE